MPLPFFTAMKKMPSDPFQGVRDVTLFTVAYLLIATFFSLTTNNWEFVLYVAVVLIFGGVVFKIHRHAKLPKELLWCLSIWGLLHMVGGLVYVPESWSVSVGFKHVMYNVWVIPYYLKYDHIVHMYGFGVATLVCWQAVRSLLKNSVPTNGVLILCVIASMGLGSINEMVEFFAKIFIPFTNVGGYNNTMWDLVSNTVGSIFAAILIKFIYESEKSKA